MLSLEEPNQRPEDADGEARNIFSTMGTYDFWMIPGVQDFWDDVDAAISNFEAFKAYTAYTFAVKLPITMCHNIFFGVETNRKTTTQHDCHSLIFGRIN